MNDSQVPERALDDGLKDYVRTRLKTLEGMINPPAAWLSAILCRSQHDLGVLSNCDANYLEIGVYKGLFLALLAESTADYAFPIIGIDPFQLDGQDYSTVSDGIASAVPNSERISLIEALSSQPDQFEPILAKQSTKLIHVDGSHRFHQVVEDLHLADRLIADDGIVIADDFPKQWQLEVLEAVIVYLYSDNPELVPFAVAGTKLFMCRADMVKPYQDHIISYAFGNQDVGSCAQLVDHMQNHQPWRSFQPLKGFRVLMF